MNCDEVELSLPEGTQDAQVAAHLVECGLCRETARVLALATQGPLSASERARLVSLPVSVQAEWSKLQRRRDGASKFVGLAIAASLGALVASGVMWRANVPMHSNLSSAEGLDPMISLAMDEVSSSETDEEPSFEVSWPSLNEEGDVL